MRTVAAVTLALALAACGGGGADELAAVDSELNQDQIGAALGPVDQSAVEDAAGVANPESDLPANESATSAKLNQAGGEGRQ